MPPYNEAEASSGRLAFRGSLERQAFYEFRSRGVWGYRACDEEGWILNLSKKEDEELVREELHHLQQKETSAFAALPQQQQQQGKDKDNDDPNPKDKDTLPNRQKIMKMTAAARPPRPMGKGEGKGEGQGTGKDTDNQRMWRAAGPNHPMWREAGHATTPGKGGSSSSGIVR